MNNNSDRNGQSNPSNNGNDLQNLNNNGNSQPNPSNNGNDLQNLNNNGNGQQYPNNNNFNPNNGGYPNPGYPNGGYPNPGYPNGGYPNPGYPNNYANQSGSGLQLAKSCKGLAIAYLCLFLVMILFCIFLGLFGFIILVCLEIIAIVSIVKTYSLNKHYPNNGALWVLYLVGLFIGITGIISAFMTISACKKIERESTDGYYQHQDPFGPRY